MLNTPLGRFRAVSLSEGVSFLVLLGVAMPLKYYAGMPEAVLAVGWIHGILFILYVAALLLVGWAERWSFGKMAAGFAASLLPFGPFVFDRWLRREAAAPVAQGGPPSTP